MHVVPFFLSCLTLCFLGIVGFAVVDLLGNRYSGVCRWLLMPFTGLALYALAATFLNRAGLPARNFAAPLLFALALANIAYGIRYRPQIRWRQAALWGGAVVVALLIVGWPLVTTGTDWVSTGNGDMTVYALGANHFYEHGFYQVPSPAQLGSEEDRSWDLSFQYSLGEVRSASQLILACFMALTGFSAVQGYMTLIIALHVLVILTVSALVCTRRSGIGLPLVVFLAIASSAELVYGTLVQLLAQDFGLAALGACTLALLEVPPVGMALVARACLCGLYVATLAVAYPELAPFLAVAFLVFVAIALFRRAMPWRRVLIFVSIIGLLTLIFSDFSLVGTARELSEAAGSMAGNAAVNEIFPFYMMPLGFAIGWGLLPYGTSDVSSLQSQICVIVGALLYVLALVLAARMTWLLNAAGAMAVTMLLLMLYLFATQNGFGLFKLAMYAQPFVLATLVVAIWPFLSPIVKANSKVLT